MCDHVTKVLFVCSQNRLRSPTAECVFGGVPTLECRSAGTDASANVLLDQDLIGWADAIFVMEQHHRKKIIKTFRNDLDGKRIVILGIPDDFEFMDAELVRLLRMKVEPWLCADPPDAA